MFYNAEKSLLSENPIYPFCDYPNSIVVSKQEQKQNKEGLSELYVATWKERHHVRFHCDGINKLSYATTKKNPCCLQSWQTYIIHDWLRVRIIARKMPLSSGHSNVLRKRGQSSGQRHATRPNVSPPTVESGLARSSRP